MYPRFTKTVSPHRLSKSAYGNEAFDLIRNNSPRDNQIISDIEDTWHPGEYSYGRDDARMALMERLRKAGIEIRLVEESCERYTIIDREIVWYGSVNFLTKEDIDDNLLRVDSREIAMELLEMTFGTDLNLLDSEKLHDSIKPHHP